MPDVEGTLLASTRPWLLPDVAEASGAADLEGGRTALAEPTVGAGGASLGTLRVVRATAKGRCGAAPCCTTSAKDGLFENVNVIRCRASRKVMFSFTLIVIISFSFFQAGQALEYAG